MASEYVFADEWDVDAPIEAVYDVVVDARTYPEWWKPVYIDVQADGPPEPGQVSQQHFKGRLPYTLHTTSEIVRLDRVVWRTVTGWDLTARRAGGGVHLDWGAGRVAVRADRGRIAQALGNVLANAVEHGGGHVRVTGRRTARGIRIEVRDSGRGHGFGIATRAIRESGGTLRAARAGSGTAVSIDLPLAEDEPPAAA